MMRLYTFCCLIFSGMLPVQGQVFEWANGWGWSDAATFNAASGISITTDDLGNSYVTGGFSGTVDFDPGTGTYFASTEVEGPNNGIYISKLDTGGSFVWVKTITDNDFGLLAPSMITTDAWNNIYIAGSFQDTIDIDPGPGIFMLYPGIDPASLNPNGSTFILKLSSSGDFLWARTFTGTAHITSSGLQADSKGNIFAIGTFSIGNIDCDPGPGIDTLSCTTTPGFNGYLVKLDTAGSYYWCYGFGGTNPWDRGNPYGIKTDCNGNIVIAGAYSGTVDFGDGEPQSTKYGFSPNDSDLFVLKIDEDGNFSWVKTAGGPNIDIPYNITLDDLGNIITTGRLRSDSMDFDPGPDVHMVFKYTAPAYGSDLFIWKLDEDGNFSWVKHFGREDALVGLSGRSLTTDVENSIYIAGTFTDTTDFDPGTGVFYLDAPPGSTPSGLLLKLTDNGDLAWAYNTGTDMYPNGLNTDFLGNILITGSYRSSTADFDPGTGVFTLPHPNIGDAAFVLKLSCASCRFTDRNTHRLPYCSFKDTMMLSAPESYDVYTWDDGSTGRTRTIDSGGTYWVRGKGCNRYLADTFILYPVEIQADLGPDTTICNENYYELATGTQNASFLWSDGSEAESLGVNSSGRYWVSVQKQGCEISDTVQVTIKDLRRELGPDHIFCKGDAIQVTLSAAIPDGMAILWSTGEPAAHITVRDTGLYFFTLTDAPCSFSDSTSVAIDPFCDCAFLMPTAFSPNGDGINDLFAPVIENGCPASRYSLNIFNRFGQRVFSSTDGKKGWDGLQNGVPVDAGTYFYELRFHSGTRQKERYRKGDVTLVR